jgi:hypothetical protein
MRAPRLPDEEMDLIAFNVACRRAERRVLELQILCGYVETGEAEKDLLRAKQELDELRAARDVLAADALVARIQPESSDRAGPSL